MTHNILIYTIPNTELLVPSSAVFSLNLENCYRKARHRYRSAQAFNAFGSAMKLREPKTARLNLNVFFGGMEILPVLVQVFQNLSKDEEEPFLTQVNYVYIYIYTAWVSCSDSCFLLLEFPGTGFISSRVLSGFERPT